MFCSKIFRITRFARDPEGGSLLIKSQIASAIWWLFYLPIGFEALLQPWANKKAKKSKLIFWLLMVGVAGFEPATSSSQTRRDDRATLHPDKVFIIMKVA